MEPNRVSDERLEELRVLAAAYNLAQTPQEDRDLVAVIDEVEAHRARLAQSQQVVDLEGLERDLDTLAGYAEEYEAMCGPIIRLDALLASLEAGVQECPAPDCEGGVIFPPTGEKCPKCHGSGRVIILAAKPAEEGDR